MASSHEYPSTFWQRRAKSVDAKRGDAVLISMENYPGNMVRGGAELDRGRMETLFKTLHFEVTEEVDKKAAYLKERLIDISEGIQAGTSDCFVCFVSAHGNTDEQGHYIKDESGAKVYIINDILKPFMSCKSLKGVPKVFFINACRGSNRDKRDGSTDGMVEYLKRDGNDSLVVFSTEEGLESMRSKGDGTHFVQAFCDAVHAKRETDVVDMVTVATRILRKNTQESWRRKSVKKNSLRCQVAPCHYNLTGKLYWRSQKPSATSADQEKNVENIIVGQDEHREGLKKWLVSSQTMGASRIESQSFGISGTGGIGKTTLAKSLYEDVDVRYHFDHRVYWVTVKKTPDIMECQRRLISEICKETPSVGLDTEQVLLKELQGKLSKMRRVLLCLDDIWDRKHVYRLLGDPFLKTLPPGSRCIITSRNSAELKGLDAKFLKLDVLSHEDAKTLFCSKAFLDRKFPEKDDRLAALVEEVIGACGNMPILLSTLGADRWGISDVELWEEFRDRLRNVTPKITPDDEREKYQSLIEQLKISYDDLPEGDSDDGVNYKDCFLDFAAFPEREEIENAVLMDMWTKPGLAEDEAYRILEELEQRCLVKISGHWCHMHDIFRALAIQIVEKPPVKNRKRLFAWGMTNSLLPENWEIPSNARSEEERVVFETEKMVIARSELKAFHPSDSILFKCLTRLRMLLITSNLSLLSLPSAIGFLTSLEKLDLSWCLGLNLLPPEIGQLERLQKLNLAGCCSLADIPREVGKLHNLVEFNMQSCGIVSLPDEIGELTNLTYLCLNDCSALETLPEVLGNLLSLERLECDMLRIREIPKALGNLRKLHHVSFCSCGLITEIPAEFGNLRSLVSMFFRASHQLQVVPDVLENLMNLAEFDVSDTRVKRETLPENLSKLQDRNEVNLRNFNDGHEVEEFQGPGKRGVLVNPTSVFDPSSKAERRASFGLSQIISMVKTEPFLSKRFDTAIRIMHTMANYAGTRHAIVRSGGLPILLRCIDKGAPDRCGEYAAATVRNICLTHSTHKAVFDAQGFAVLIRVLHREANDIRFYAYQALSLIINADVQKHDYEFTSEIYDRCVHTFGEKEGVSECMKHNGGCIFCLTEKEFRDNPAIKARLKS